VRVRDKWTRPTEPPPSLSRKELDEILAILEPVTLDPRQTDGLVVRLLEIREQFREHQSLESWRKEKLAGDRSDTTQDVRRLAQQVMDVATELGALSPDTAGSLELVGTWTEERRIQLFKMGRMLLGSAARVEAVKRREPEVGRPLQWPETLALRELAPLFEGLTGRKASKWTEGVRKRKARRKVGPYFLPFVKAALGDLIPPDASLAGLIERALSDEPILQETSSR